MSTAPAHCFLLRVVGGYFDHYLGNTVRCDGQECLLLLDHFSLPEKLVRALVHFHKLQLRSRRPPPPFPHLTDIVFNPRHLQRFPRSCVLLTACRLATPPCSFEMTNADWINCIVVRFSSCIVKKVEVRRVRVGLCDVHAITAVLIFLFIY